MSLKFSSPQILQAILATEIKLMYILLSPSSSVFLFLLFS